MKVFVGGERSFQTRVIFCVENVLKKGIRDDAIR